jgi:hypothetical protein
MKGNPFNYKEFRAFYSAFILHLFFFILQLSYAFLFRENPF